MTTDERWLRGDWMQTHSGRRFYPKDPMAHEVDPEDIAHALSLLCRYGGHVDRFYSVAEHSVLMSYAAPAEHALTALLHDATEAYVCDLPRPLKILLPDYRDMEARVWLAIVDRFEGYGFRVPVLLPDEVKAIDTRILIDEKRALFRHSEQWGVELDGLEPLGVEVQGWGPVVAETRFLDRLEELTSSVYPATDA